jgi:hypothetical protein
LPALATNQSLAAYYPYNTAQNQSEAEQQIMVCIIKEWLPLKFRNLSLSAISIMIALLSAGCSDGGSNPAGPNGNTTLTAHWQGTNGIGAFATQHCTPCHISQSQNGLNLSSYAGAIQGGATGNTIVPGNPDNSYIIWKLSGDARISGVRMPQGGPYLTPAQMDTIKSWIQAGALNN